MAQKKLEFNLFFYLKHMFIFIHFLLLFLILIASFVVWVKNPLHSILLLTLIFLLTSILLFCLSAEFLALSFVIIYAGAIAILFLFIIMMLNIKKDNNTISFLKYTAVISLIFSYAFPRWFFIPLNNSFIEFDFLSNINYIWLNWFDEIEFFSNINTIGQVLYTNYFIYFLIAGFILFVGILGALSLTIKLNQK
jgi:NADH-quinone oxidoreductase subunit J